MSDRWSRDRELTDGRVRSEEQAGGVVSTLILSSSGQVLFVDPSFSVQFGCVPVEVVGAEIGEVVLRSTSSLGGDALGSLVAERREVRGYVRDLLVSVNLRRVGLMNQRGRAEISSFGLPGALLEGESVFLVATVVRLGAMRAEVESQLRGVVGRVMSGFAHEVRNPLAAITSLSEAVMFLSDDPDVEDTLQRIPALVDRVESLIQLLLAYGRPTEPRLGWHKLGHIVTTVLEVLSHSGVVSDVPVRPASLLESELHVDDTQVVSVLTNLLQNAAQAGDGSAPELRLGVLEVGGESLEIAIDVVDRGPGVPEGLRDKIFEPFFTRRAGGTGLGLALARDLARMNGGDVTLVSTGTSGSTFRLLLPMGARRATP